MSLSFLSPFVNPWLNCWLNCLIDTLKWQGFPWQQEITPE
jgi:hypothetical protein